MFVFVWIGALVGALWGLAIDLRDERARQLRAELEVERRNRGRLVLGELARMDQQARELAGEPAPPARERVPYDLDPAEEGTT